MGKTGLAVAQASAAAPPRLGTPEHVLMHELAPMLQFGQMQGVMHRALLRLLLAHNGHAGDPRAQIELEGHRLQGALLLRAIFQANDERHTAVDDRATALEEQAGPLLCARHQRLLVLVQNGNHAVFLADSLRSW